MLTRNKFSMVIGKERRDIQLPHKLENYGNPCYRGCLES
jgi:hypothetical protein